MTLQNAKGSTIAAIEMDRINLLQGVELGLALVPAPMNILAI